MEYVDSFKLFEAKLNEETLSDGEFAIVAIKKKYKYKQRYQKAVAWEPGTEMLASLGDGPFPDEISVRSVRGGGFGVDNEEFYKFWSVVKKISKTEFWKLAKTLPDMFDDDNAVIPSGFKINESEILEAKYNSDKKITMNNLDWGKSTAERNANLDKYNSLETDKEKNAFLKKLKSESIVSEAKELNFEQEWNTLSTHIQHDLLKDIRDKKIADKFAGDFWENLPHFIQRDLKKELTKIMSESIVSEAKELVWLDKGDPSKEVRVTDDGGYVTIMQKDFEGRVIRVLIDTKQIPQLIAALKKAK